VHQIRTTTRFVTYQDRKRFAADLRAVYRAVNADAAEAARATFDEKWGQKDPMIAASWRARWQHIVAFLALPAELRRAVYTTNSIENLNRQITKSIKTRGHFPDEQPPPGPSTSPSSAPSPSGGAPTTGPPPSEASKIHFADRLPD
jgi:putative transposase